MSKLRYAVGIDLGTTNSALAYVDLDAQPRRLVSFAVPQLVAAGDVAARPTLPSFLYLPAEHELPAGATALPWPPRAATSDIVGEFARTHGAQVPGRLVLSAKSWLCHPSVDRRAAILPWTAPPEVARRSPVEVSAAFLCHLGDAFRHATGASFAECEVVLTVPASFDEVARELTVEAADRAGLPHLVLLEEPQAAFYSLLADHEGHGARPGSMAALPLAPGALVLVCDIGGGTTDFSLIRCVQSDDVDGDQAATAHAGPGTATRPGAIRFERTAVGDHLLLGGDNMDLALARHVERRIAARDKSEKLDAARFLAAVQACRVAKEKLLGEEARARWTIHVAGRGRSLVGGGVSVELERAEAEQAILEGFFPRVAADAEPGRASGAGLREFGLPYASDAAVTRHLAAFLCRHDAAPDSILFNGGVLHARAIRERIVEVVGSFAGRVPTVLDNAHPEVAVARGAAWFALVRRSESLRNDRIRGGAARAYYVEVDAPGVEGDTRVTADTVTALCLAARGEQEGGARVELASATSGRQFEVLTNRPVRFQLLSSSDRHDRVGDLVTLPAGTLAELPPIVTVLRFARSSQDVSLKVRLLVERTELGTLDIQLHSTEGDRFQLAFDLRDRLRDRPRDQVPDQLRAADQPALAASTSKRAGAEAESARIAPARVAVAEEVIRRLFDKASAAPLPPAQAMRELCTALGADKGAWPVAVLRALWEPLKSLRGQRGRTAEHEARWLNLVGYSLRPGYGYPLDDWRVKEAWRLWNAGLVHDKDPRCRLEWWILWRRVSGGLTRTMQDELAKRLIPTLAPSAEAKKRTDRKAPSQQEAAEMFRAAGSCERLAAIEKWQLGESLLRDIEHDARKGAKGNPQEPQVWALGRLGARVPLYGPIDGVISPKRAEKWVERLLGLDWATDSSRLGHNSIAFAVAEIARASGDRGRDLDEPLRQRVVARLESATGGPHLARLVAEPTELEAADERFAFGEALPAGLRLTSTEGRVDDDAPAT